MASALSDLPVGQEVKFGTTYPRVARIAAPATCVRQTSWEQITNTPASRGWRISFDSPLAIRRGDYDQPWPEPYTLLRRLEERWALFGPTVDGSVFSEVHARHLMVTGADLRTVASDAPGPGKELWGVEGLVEWLYPVADGGADVIHRLLLFSEYAGMGARTEYGLGSVSVSEMAGDVRSLFRARRHAAVQSLSESRHEARSNLRHLAKKGA
ncbi:MAG: CRISPR system precrRNA processing endoribonuclease RAMP protein Cas6 [Propionibacteriaceae bacterium]|nr:CRISPR system precrRNA processing endoribonuclease RAMP protein Cas6 [Propionibacteriaceae bacterium]